MNISGDTAVDAANAGVTAADRVHRNWGWMLRLWKLRWPLAFSVFLISPLFFYELRLGQPGPWRPDRVLAFVLPSSCLLLLAWHLVFRRLWLAHALLFPFFLTVAVDLWNLAQFGTRLTASTISVCLENLVDAGPFLRLHVVSISLALASLFAVYGFGIWQMRQLLLKWQPGWLALCGSGLVLVYYTAYRGSAHGWSDVISRDRGSPFGILPQFYTAWQIHRDERAHHEAAANFRFGARREAVGNETEAYLLVLGESSRRDHWGLYGYSRDTTPLLRREPGLVVFADVVAPAALTQLAVPLALTRARIDQMSLPQAVTQSETAAPDRFPPERSIISAFAEVGFETWWLGTQQRDQWTGHANWYSAEAQTQRSFDRLYDGVLVDTVRQVLERGLASGKKRFFFVLHTSGSHLAYADRVPPQFARFSRGSSDSRGRLVDSYDDTIVYTDRVLADAIAVLRQRVQLSALLFLSDHGENLKDDGRGLTGHFHNNEYDLPVPMFLWTSEAWNQRWPSKLAAARANAQRPLTTTVVFHTLADLADIRVEGDRRQELSLLRPTLARQKRLVLCPEGVCDFDSSEVARRLARLRSIATQAR